MVTVAKVQLLRRQAQSETNIMLVSFFRQLFYENVCYLKEYFQEKVMNVVYGK